LPIINVIANGFVAYWGGASLQPLYPPVIPVPGAITNLLPVTQVLVTNPGIQVTIPFTYEGLDNVDGFLDKIITAANVHLSTVQGLIFTTAVFPGGVTGVGVGNWAGYSMTGNSVDFSQLDPNAFTQDAQVLENLRKRFSGLINPEELRAQLQAEADELISTIPPAGGGALLSNETVDISSIDLSAGWVSIAAQFISKKEGFTETASWDVNAYRLGYGTDKIIGSDGRIRTVVPGDVTTREAAIKMLEYEIVQRFKPRLVGNGDRKITEEQFNNLSDGAKASLLSYVYNVGSLRVGIATAVRSGDTTLAAQLIKAGPTTGGGVVYPGLVKRRSEEAQLFLS
jgi:GH24 family phage-related lysozyme (muramidase)